MGFYFISGLRELSKDDFEKIKNVTMEADRETHSPFISVPNCG